MNWMTRIPRLLRRWLPVAGGAVFLTLWVIAEAGRWAILEKTLVFALLAIAIALSERLPLVSLGGLLGVQVLQLVGLVHEPESTTWPMYLAGPIIALVVGANASRLARIIAVPAGLAFAVLVALLMVYPRGSQGGWASWTGQISGPNDLTPVRDHPMQGDLLGIGLISAGLFLGALAVGILYRSSRSGVIRRLWDLSEATQAEPPTGPSLDDDARLSALSPREREIFVLLAQGLSNAEIADASFVSESTVKSHVRAILRKLELRSRSQVVAFAYERPVAAS
jgi:DNA-binding CsgD family transcriptional regulator